MTQPSVLIVDSHRDCRESLALALDLAGCNVQPFASGLEAMIHLRQATPDAVLLDSHIGEASALHVARVLRANPRFDATRLVITCTWMRADLRAQVEASGVDALWMKPFLVADLLEVVNGGVRRMPGDAMPGWTPGPRR